MKIKENYKLREMAGETIVVNQGMTSADLTRIISLNASARLLWEQLAGKDFTLNDAAQILVSHYGIDPTQATEDAAKWVEALQSCGVLTE